MLDSTSVPHCLTSRKLLRRGQTLNLSAQYVQSLWQLCMQTMVFRIGCILPLCSDAAQSAGKPHSNSWMHTHLEALNLVGFYVFFKDTLNRGSLHLIANIFRLLKCSVTLILWHQTLFCNIVYRMALSPCRKQL